MNDSLLVPSKRGKSGGLEASGMKEMPRLEPRVVARRFIVLRRMRGPLEAVVASRARVNRSGTASMVRLVLRVG